jgi:hypothetical protein
MKIKNHKFVVTVESHLSKSEARTAILVAFAKRNPDGCSFNLSNYKNPKPKVIILTEYIDSNYNP